LVLPHKATSQRFCSQKCHYAIKQVKDLKCATCGVMFHGPPSGKRKYCSKKCFDGRQLLKTQCEHCGKEFDVRSSQYKGVRFCSKECRFKSYLQPKIFTCEYCTKRFLKTSRDEIRFCSHECYVRWVREHPPSEPERFNKDAERLLRVLLKSKKSRAINVERGLMRLLMIYPHIPSHLKQKSKTNLITLLEEMENYYVRRQKQTTRRAKT
jgi:hypothetical protein